MALTLTTRTWTAVALASLVGLVVGAVALLAGPEPGSTGRVPLSEDATTTERPSTSPGRAQPSSAPRVRARPARIPEQPDELAKPVRLRVGAVGLDQPVRPVGVRVDGQMELPANPDVLGWYRFGPAPLDRSGSVVVAGHLDSRRYGVGPLMRLRDVELGARVTVTLSTGRDAAYVVRRIERYDRQALPDELFTREGPELLRLVTCGGAYDSDAGGYQQNLVVTATPVGERP